MMELSIIIAHFNPGNHRDCLKSFHKTLSSINKSNYSIEIIIADDGSITNKEIQNIAKPSIEQNGKKIYHLQCKSLESWKNENDFNYPNIKHWLYLPKIEQVMGKARISNASIMKAKSNNLFFLDDDNYFISNDPIKKIMNFFKDYELIIGQIKDKNGHFRPYSSNRVQGTTFGIKKEILINVGLFGEWTESVSSGVDSDLWWRLYHHFKKNTKLKACYTSEIQTIDSCSKRWRPFIKTFFRKRQLIKAFNNEHQCPNYTKVKYNPSRNKKNWMIDLT
ncbi:MAG: glycosyltransferase [Pelagibacterales bacterium]|nr:glycosyltransferase [Pelagibacterales bacterium]